MSRQEMFREYPDVVNIEQLCEMLGGVSVKAAYRRSNKSFGLNCTDYAAMI